MLHCSRYNRLDLIQRCGTEIEGDSDTTRLREVYGTVTPSNRGPEAVPGNKENKGRGYGALSTVRDNKELKLKVETF